MRLYTNSTARGKRRAGPFAPNQRRALVFVEFRMEDPKVPIKLVHKMSERQVIKEMSTHPLKHVETIKTLPWQHIIVFEKKKEEPKKP